MPALPIDTSTPMVPPIVVPSIPGVRLTSSMSALSRDTKMAMLIWASSGWGKTNLAGSLDALTQKYGGKRTIYIPLEAGEGGGIATIRSLDLPMYIPKDYSELFSFLGFLRNDKSIGGVVLDSATEMYKNYVKIAALKYPCRENVATRAAGVPTRSDYQVLNELSNGLFRALLALTTHDKPENRKHLIVTATDMSIEEDDRTVWEGPSLTKTSAKEAVQMFQQVGTIQIKPQLVDGKRTLVRSLTFQGDGVKALKDRYDVFPGEIPLRKNPQSPGEDLLTMYEKWWLPKLSEVNTNV